MAIAARAAGVESIDTVWLDVKDPDGLEADARVAADMGFSGKLCIHPGQIERVHRVFTPSQEAIDHARRVLKARDEAKAEGRGVFTVAGKMVDAPVIAAQERVLSRARRAGVA